MLELSILKPRCCKPTVPRLASPVLGHCKDFVKRARVVRAEGDAAAAAADDDPRPRRWNHAVVVLIAVLLVGSVLGYGIADGCMCAPHLLHFVIADLILAVPMQPSLRAGKAHAWADGTCAPQ